MSTCPILYLLLCVQFFHVFSKFVTIHNDIPRIDNKGNIVNAHDGGIYQFVGFPHKFFMYGTAYEDCYQNNSQCQPPCGYNPNTFSLYVSDDLVTWEFWSNNILPEQNKDNKIVNYWMPNVAKHPNGYFIMNYWSSACGFKKNCTNLAISTSPYGPFIMLPDVPISSVPSSQMGLFVDYDTGNAYVKYNTAPPEQHHAIQQLSTDWKTTVGNSFPIFWKPSFPWNEGGGMFKRGKLYYYMTGSDCCFCQWGGDSKVWTSYDPLGPWHPGIAPEPSNTLCDLTGRWVCHNGSNVYGKCDDLHVEIHQFGNTFTFGTNGNGTVNKNGYIFASQSPNNQPGVVTSANGKSAGCDRIRWYGDETKHWCRFGHTCAIPSPFLDPTEVNFCSNGVLPPEGIRDNPCDPKNPDLGLNFTIPAQQFNVVSLNINGNSTFIYYGERSMSAPDRLKSHNFQAWVPMEFQPNGEIRKLNFPSTFILEV